MLDTHDCTLVFNCTQCLVKKTNFPILYETKTLLTNVHFTTTIRHRTVWTILLDQRELFVWNCIVKNVNFSNCLIQFVQTYFTSYDNLFASVTYLDKTVNEHFCWVGMIPNTELECLRTIANMMWIKVVIALK